MFFALCIGLFMLKIVVLFATCFVRLNKHAGIGEVHLGF
jgi:hypothetical protein